MRRGNSAKFREWATDFGFFIVGGVLYGLSVNLFTAPNQIAPGGLTGLSTVFNFLWGTPIGGVIFLLNIPLFLWAILSVGYKLVIKTIVATAVSSAAIDILSLVVPPYQNNLMLAAVFGGVVEGFALALIFMQRRHNWRHRYGGRGCWGDISAYLDGAADDVSGRLGRDLCRVRLSEP